MNDPQRGGWVPVGADGRYRLSGVPEKPDSSRSRASTTLASLDLPLHIGSAAPIRSPRRHHARRSAVSAGRGAADADIVLDPPTVSDGKPMPLAGVKCVLQVASCTAPMSLGTRIATDGTAYAAFPACPELYTRSAAMTKPPTPRWSTFGRIPLSTSMPHRSTRASSSAARGDVNSPNHAHAAPRLGVLLRAIGTNTTGVELVNDRE